MLKKRLITFLVNALKLVDVLELFRAVSRESSNR
jgi:hypothetical protein